MRRQNLFLPLLLFIVYTSLYADNNQDTDDASFSIFEGINAGVDGDFNKALEKFNFALKTLPNYADLIVYKKIVDDHFSDMLSNKKIIKIFKIVSALNKGELLNAQININNINLNNYAPVHYICGRIYMKRQMYQKAKKEFSNAIKINPNFIIYYYLRGTVYEILDEYNLAYSDFQKIIHIDSTFVAAYLRSGEIATILRNYKDAIENFDTVRDYVTLNGLSMSFFESLNNYGAFLLKQKKYHESIEILSRSLLISSKNDQPFLNRGIAYKNLQEFEKSLLDFNQALELEKNSIDALYNRALVYKEMQKYKLALKDLNKIRHSKSKTRSIYFAIGEINIKLKEYNKAIVYFDKLLQIEPGDVWANYWIALAYDMKKNFITAMMYYKKFINIAPGEYFKQITFAKNRIKKIGK